MSLADQIIEHGPYEAYALVPNEVMRWIESGQLNELRDELIAARALKEMLASGRFELSVSAYCDGDGAYVNLHHGNCDIAEYEAEGGGPTLDLAELVQRAGEHAEVCR